MKHNYTFSRILNSIAGKLIPATFAFIFLFPSLTQAWNYTLATNLNSVAAANICPGLSKVPIYGFSINVTANGGSAASFTGFKFTTTGTYTAGSITQFQLWRSSTNTNSFASATLLIQTLNPAAGPGLQTFPA